VIWGPMVATSSQPSHLRCNLIGVGKTRLKSSRLSLVDPVKSIGVMEQRGPAKGHNDKTTSLSIGGSLLDRPAIEASAVRVPVVRARLRTASD
jgi:hypothetical protein